jgi:tetratricopeptide (TPR) repeat protein
MSSLDQGLAYYRAGRYEPAALALDDAVRQRPDDAAAWNNRGATRVRLGQEVGALGDYTKAIELNPADPELHFNRANAYMLLGNYEYAIKDLNRAIELAPHYAKAYFNRGTARLRGDGDRAGADADWRYAIALETDPYAQAAMARSAGITPAAVRAAVASMPGTVPATAHVPLPPPPPPPPSAMPALPSAPAETLDARALALRGMSRELDGDHLGALADLRTAIGRETDATRRANLERLLRALDMPR